MKTAKDILNEKNCGSFCLERCCDEIAKFFKESSPKAKLLVIGHSFDYDTANIMEFYGYAIHVKDVIDYATTLIFQNKRMPKIESFDDFGIIEVETSAIRRVIDELRKNDFHTERESPGIYTVSLI